MATAAAGGTDSRLPTRAPARTHAAVAGNRGGRVACAPDSLRPLRQNRRMPFRTSLQLRLLLLGATLMAAPVLASAAPAAPAVVQAPAYATGDAWLDERLADIDRYAARYPDAFLAEVERYAGISRGYVEGLLAQPGWRAGDAWYACFLARAVQTSCRDVVRTRTRSRGAAWSDVAGALEAGRDAHAAVRLALADSYRRWDRPLRPDAALERALRERAQATPDAQGERGARGD